VHVVGELLSVRTAEAIVLVHGSWADGSSWTDVVKRLQREGYQVFAPPNPLRSLAGDAEYLRAFLSTVPGPIVLVGHSYGGAVITNAATGNPNVQALVYVDAFAPDKDEEVLRLTGPDSALAGTRPDHGLRPSAVPRRSPLTILTSTSISRSLWTPSPPTCQSGPH
jgi:pimeloyl-ACP methyl ester carboxylesterase